MKRLGVPASLALAGFLSLSFSGYTVVHADNGVGPSSNALTGQNRACEVHAANVGQSDANGLQCAAPTFTATVTGQMPGTTNVCSLTVNGSGLSAGTGLFYVDSADPTVTHVLFGGSPTSFQPLVVAADGTVNATTFFANSGDTITLSATTGAGSTITTSFVASC